MNGFSNFKNTLSVLVSTLFTLSASLSLGSVDVFAEETNSSLIAEPPFPPGHTLPLSSNESLLLGQTIKTQEDVTGTPEALIALNVLKNVTAAPNVTDTEDEPPSPPPAGPIPSVVHLRLQIHEIQVYRDHDEGFFPDGEWHLYGVVSCCGGAVNSATPTIGFSFNAPGVENEGEIDTPDNEMNDVTGTRRGGWGTVETVKFANVKQDFDIDNTNPLSEINIDFFGKEDDAISAQDFPPIPDIQGSDFDEYAEGLRDVIIFLNNMDDVDHLGNAHLVFNKANNYGLTQDSHVTIAHAASDLIYNNVWYKSQDIESNCTGGDVWTPDCDSRNFKDWPDFPDYIIVFTITDRDGPRCASGLSYNYSTGECQQMMILK